MKENDKNKRAHDIEMRKIDNQILAWIDFQKNNEQKIVDLNKELKDQETRIYEEFKSQIVAVTEMNQQSQD